MMQALRWWMVTLLTAAGCVGPNRESDRPVTTVDPKLATIDHWIDQPVQVSVHSTDFDRLWSACERCVKDRSFKVDRQDQRSGLLTSEPLISKQFFELWRQDVVAIDWLCRSSLATMRRTVQFEITRDADEGFVASPKVIIEQEAASERQLPSAALYTSVFSADRVEGSKAADAGETLASDYWYAVGRDTALEKDLARDVEAMLQSDSVVTDRRGNE